MISPELLRRFSLFTGIDPAILKDVAMLGTELTAAEGEWLFQEGDEGDALYLIISGEIELKINLDETGEKKADISSHVDGAMIGWSSMVEPYVYTLGAVVTREAHLVKLDASDLRRFMNSNPEMGLKIMCRLAKLIGERLNEMRVRFVSVV